MASRIKPGEKEIRYRLPEKGEPLTTLQQFADKCGLSPAKATQVVIVLWSDATNGHPVPFGATTVVSQPAQAIVPAEETPTESEAEVLARQERLQKSASQW